MIVSLLITILGILFALTGFGYHFYDDGHFLVKGDNELSRAFNADMDFLYFSFALIHFRFASYYLLNTHHYPLMSLIFYVCTGSARIGGNQDILNQPDYVPFFSIWGPWDLLCLILTFSFFAQPFASYLLGENSIVTLVVGAPIFFIYYAIPTLISLGIIGFLLFALLGKILGFGPSPDFTKTNKEYSVKGTFNGADFNAKVREDK